MKAVIKVLEKMTIVLEEMTKEMLGKDKDSLPPKTVPLWAEELLQLLVEKEDISPQDLSKNKIRNKLEDQAREKFGKLYSNHAIWENKGKWTEYLRHIMTGETSPLIFLNQAVDPHISEDPHVSLQYFKMQIEKLDNLKKELNSIPVPPVVSQEKLAEELRNLYILTENQHSISTEYDIVYAQSLAFLEKISEDSVPISREKILDCLKVTFDSSKLSPNFREALESEYPFLFGRNNSRPQCQNKNPSKKEC